jgi:tetratricopeptide (TPR) repeat protein
MRSRSWLTVGVVDLGIFAAALGVAAALAGCSGSQAPGGGATGAASGLPRADREVFAEYAGSASCRGCHTAIGDGWQRSHHGLAERAVSSALDSLAFAPPRAFQHGTQQTEVSLIGGRARLVALGPGNRQAPFEVERVIGADPLRQFLTPFPGGRWQTLEASYDPRRGEWFDVYGNEDRMPGEWGHWTGRGMNWNSRCASCHNTRLRKNYDAAADRYTTAMAERSVGCEACHGPMKAHVRWQTGHARRSDGGSGGAPRDPTLKRLTRDQGLETCGSCHARRGDLTGDFVPGDHFDDHYLLTVVDESDTYYPDGQVHDEDYEYAAFLGSRMHAAGVRCIDCHDPHTAATLWPGNLLCLSCHGERTSRPERSAHAPGETAPPLLPIGPLIDPVRHGFHHVDALYFARGGADTAALARRDPAMVAKSGGECVNCHMPQTTYMERHRRHDHGLTIPDPLLTERYGIPNACNRCHADRSATWARRKVDAWYGARMERPSRRRAVAIAEARRGMPAARDTLVAMLAGEPVQYWRAVAAGLLPRWAGDPVVAAALATGARDSSALVRANAVRALGSGVEDRARDAAGDRRAGARSILEAALADPVRVVRHEAAWALRAQLDPRNPAAVETRRILAFDDDQPVGQMREGAWHLARGELDSSLAHYRTAVEWDPNSAPLRHDYAIVLARLGQNDEAVRQLEQACRLEPLEAEYRFKLALAWNEVGRPDSAIAALRSAVTLDPAYARAWYDLGLALDAAGREREALGALVRAEAANPRDADAPYARATILLKLGRRAEAREAAAHALRAQPDHRSAAELIRGLE